MRVSFKWIKELLPDLKVSASVLEKRLTSAGIEVEAVTRQAEGLEALIVGEVRELAPHPDAERLRVATVFDGQSELTVVCGAPNVAAGQRVAFAPVGAKLPNGLAIAERSIRGVQSFGMICSEAELGLSEESEGIIVLKPRSRPGRPLVDVLGLDDVFFELSIGPNRPDLLSHLGLAREIAAIYQLPPPKSAVRVRETSTPASRVKVEIKDTKRCPKYFGRVLSGIQVGPSPAWVQQRLKAVGLRPISNVVDATNLVLMELGHPLHAFDLAKLEGAKIVVRTARADETMKTLDGQQRMLQEEDLVIADAAKAVALAGVMGGQDAEVSDTTTEILLESAYFEPSSVRRTAKRHGLHTEASHRFERGADPSMVEYALDRCAVLIVELAGGQIHKGRTGLSKQDDREKIVSIRVERAEQVIGRPVDKTEVRESLTRLGLKPAKKPVPAKTKGKDSGKGKKAAKVLYPKDALLFQIPSWRVDLNAEEDLVEEVARLSGYESIPTILPPMSSAILGEGQSRDPEWVAREVLEGLGFLETISLAFNSKAQIQSLSLEVARAVVVANPLGEERQYMRMSMLPALFRAARLNQDNLPSIVDLRLFEIGKTFEWTMPPEDLPRERQSLAFLLRGRRMPASWTTSDEPLDAYDLKAVVERLLAAFRIEGILFEPADVAWLHPKSATQIRMHSEVVGVLGEAHPDLLAAFGLEGPTVFVADLDIAALARLAGGFAKFRPLPKLPPAQRDLSFFVTRSVAADEILRVIRAASTEGTLERVDVFDVYEGEGVPEGKKSVAVSLVFRAADRTLTDRDVDESQAGIVTALSDRLGAQIRAA